MWDFLTLHSATETCYAGLFEDKESDKRQTAEERIDRDHSQEEMLDDDWQHI